MRNLIWIVLLTLPFLFHFQNCSEVEFQSNSIKDRFGDLDCLIFENNSEDVSEDCLSKEYGLIGNLYYLLDKSDGSVLPEKLYDKDDNEILFNSTEINSVNVIIEKGYVSNHYIVMPKVSIPSIVFSDGFQVSQGQYLENHLGVKLIEAFAIDLQGKLSLGTHEPGFYAIGILSDDGSILDIDTNNDGTLETVIDNDQYHSPRLKCSSQAIYLDDKAELKMRLRYFQGPRTAIALTFVMKKVAGVDYTQDSLCDRGDNGSFRWFGGAATSPDYIPDYTSSPFGELLQRGWFIPEENMFLLPDSIE